MIRTSIIVATWLLLTGSVGDAILAGAERPLRLVGLEAVASVLTAFAVWLMVKRDVPRARTRRVRWHYD